MALTDDQKAMLRLLAQREEGYEDMAALMGISVEEVRDRVKEALAEVDAPAAAAEEPPETPVAPTPPPSPPPTQPAIEEAPASPPPPPAPEPQKPATPRARAGKRPPRLPGLKLPKDRGALIGLGAGALVVLIFAIVLIVGGGGDGSGSGSAAGGGGGTAATATENPNLTQAVLSPVDGSDASGVALFGRFKKQVLLQVTAKGLDPSQAGQSYAVWLAHSGEAMVPVGTAKAPASGDLAARFQVPTAVLVLVARSAFNEIVVTRASDAALSAAIAQARKAKAESTYTGTDVLRGRITGPFVGATAKKEGQG